jgi:hypothetical protein
MAMSRDLAPGVDIETSVLGRSLALLQAASEHAGVDGLSGPQIAKVLTEKFRHRTTRQAVGQALDSAGNKIDRHRSGSSAAVYRIMRAGEEWLATPPEDRESTARPTRGRKTVSRSKRREPSPVDPGTSDTPKKSRTTKAASKRPTRGRPGPKTAIEALVSEGFFDEPRSITDIRMELRDQKAFDYSSQDLSPALTRLLRESTLKRTKSDGQYVYTKL